MDILNKENAERVDPAARRLNKENAERVDPAARRLNKENAERTGPAARRAERVDPAARRAELLCPAGDMDCLKAALLYGADAVYLGMKRFGMRSGAGNFSDAELQEAVSLANAAGVRVYVTLNTLPRCDEIQEMPRAISHARDCGISAFIVNDPGVIELVREYAPKIPFHISVQAGIVNHKSAEFYHKLGAKRVVLARELSISEIAEIRRNTSPELELEAFVHGAVCMSVSGRCLISNYLTGRDANRGECSQPCRWKYSIVEEKRPGEYFDIIEDESGSHILNAKDMNMLAHLDKLYEAGVRSFKIEGRAKASYYVAATAAAYRAGVDALSEFASGGKYSPPKWAAEELERVSHREYYTGFYFGVPKSGQALNNGGYIRDWAVAGIVVGNEDGAVIVSQRNRFFKGETLSVLSPGRTPFEIIADEIFDKDGQGIEAAPHPEMLVKIKCENQLEIGSFLRRRQ